MAGRHGTSHWQTVDIAADTQLAQETSVPIWKFIANCSTGTKHKRVSFSLVLVRLLPRRAEILVMSNVSRTYNSGH